MEQLLNFNAPMNYQLLEQIHAALLQGSTEDRNAAQRILTQFKEHPLAWRRVDGILENTENPHVKFFALQTLESVIKYRWKALPAEQRQGIRGYVVNLIIKYSSSFDTMKKNQMVLKRLNLVLVQVLKHEWPANWPSFVPDLVASSKTSESLCTNNMHILKLLSEEIFDFSLGQMTQKKIQRLKESLHKEFQLIFRLCDYILEMSKRPDLLHITLETLLRFLNWIPLGYIFETRLVQVLVCKFFPVPLFRNTTVKCLTEIGSLSAGSQYDTFFVKFFGAFMNELLKVIPRQTNIPQAYQRGTTEDQQFIQDLSMFLGALFRTHLRAIEETGQVELVRSAHFMLAQITRVDDDEVFKICLEYWHSLSARLYDEVNNWRGSSSSNQPDQMMSGGGAPPLMFGSSASSGHIAESPRLKQYADILSEVRVALILRMPKPEEVLIIEDENGEIIREIMPDTDAIALYKTMRSTLIYLTHLDPHDTEKIMLKRLTQQCKSGKWTYQSLNTLCWAIGSISGAMMEDDEKKFLVNVIKDLLSLVDITRGKDAKAVIASNIMYIVGQYPRFLRAHWKFLQTVVKKLFEFMHEKHPGVQDMACDTFLKIAKKCRRKFVVTHPGESRPFIEEILQGLPAIVSDLQYSHIQVFFEAAGYMIHSHQNRQNEQELINKLMTMPNNLWNNAMAQANQSVERLHQLECAKTLANILKTNERACFSLGQSFVNQLSRIYLDMLNVYKAYSTYISRQIAQNGPQVTRTGGILAMRSAKQAALRLVETFVERSEDPVLIANKFMPPLLEAVLGDYRQNHPDARDAEVLSLMTGIVRKLGAAMVPQVPRVLEAVFQCTLQMITKNFTDYPDHRVHFFNLLRAINSTCFPALFKIRAEYFKLIIDSIIWAFKHELRSIAETGLHLLVELWQNIANHNAAPHFYRMYFMKLFEGVFYVLTDRSHQSTFGLQATALKAMVLSVEQGRVNAPLWPEGSPAPSNASNRDFLRNHLCQLIAKHFQNLNKPQIQNFVNGLFALSNNLPKFKSHLRDFIVQLKEFSPENNEDVDLLYLEEKESEEARSQQEQIQRYSQIPGMLAPHHPKNVH